MVQVVRTLSDKNKKKEAGISQGKRVSGVWTKTQGAQVNAVGTKKDQGGKAVRLERV